MLFWVWVLVGGTGCGWELDATAHPLATILWPRIIYSVYVTGLAPHSIHVETQSGDIVAQWGKDKYIIKIFALSKLQLYIFCFTTWDSVLMIRSSILPAQWWHFYYLCMASYRQIMGIIPTFCPWIPKSSHTFKSSTSNSYKRLLSVSPSIRGQCDWLKKC